ncbi:hypothetical protein FEZ33_09555 [Ruoffia tabacinasalis]|uniref:PepSY domain-containing protein n=1 Tax=Ruoffia tabacinasalis TaxID=87458 RepID=A0A5R9DT15_9LACT|nr:hypothetical protein [Ruoffia tabacinasalis]TLQ40021.1 hypothetical protein FEZ33_09555 [Ruoffia tabacinasalis]
MKKSLRQMLLVGLSASLLVSVAPLAYAEDVSSEEETSEVVETTEEETSEVAEESAMEEEAADVEASDVQMGLEEAVTMLEAEYPDAEIEEIDVAYDRDEQSYDITVNAINAEEDIELEVVWQDGEVTESGFNEGLFGFLDGDDAADEATNESAADDMMDGDVADEADIVENEDEAELSDDSVVEDAAEDESATSEEAPTEEERPTLDMESVITIDAATELALGEVENGEAINWNLKADASDFWDFLQPEEDQEEGPIWTVEVEEPEAMMSEEVVIDALAGSVIESPEQEESEESAEESADEAEESVEESVESEESSVE